MRAFIILCLVAVACADKLGYNYSPVGHSDSGLSFAPGSGSIGGGGGGLGGIGGLGGGSLGGGLGGGSLGGGGLGAGDLAGDSPYSAPGGGEVNKEFYSFTAPEEDFDDSQAAQRIANSQKKNLRVIFIKGPENNALEKAALALARQAAEQKTAIYVLNKQPDIGDLANKLNAIHNNNNNRPDVHFVKYRTPEDAANAQRAIQSQYNQLGGPSQSHNGGVAPVLNFASRSPVQPQSSYGGVQAPNANYLPASLFRRRFRL